MDKSVILLLSFLISCRYKHLIILMGTGIPCIRTGSFVWSDFIFLCTISPISHTYPCFFVTTFFLGKFQQKRNSSPNNLRQKGHHVSKRLDKDHRDRTQHELTTNPIVQTWNEASTGNKCLSNPINPQISFAQQYMIDAQSSTINESSSTNLHQHS